MPKIIRARSKASKRRFRKFDGKRFQLDSVFPSKSKALLQAIKIRSRFRLARVVKLPASQTVPPDKWAVYTTSI